MRLQHKLVIILLAVGLLPTALVGLVYREALRDLGTSTEAAAVDAESGRMTQQLRQAVEQAAETVQVYKNLAELVLRLQAREVDSRLARPVPSPSAVPRVYFADQYDAAAGMAPPAKNDPAGMRPGPGVHPRPGVFGSLADGSWSEASAVIPVPTGGPANLFPSSRHMRIDVDGPARLLAISRGDQVFRLALDALSDDVNDDIVRLADMAAVYRRLNDMRPDLFLWHHTALDSGMQASYPGHGGSLDDHDARRQPWYQRAKAERALVWSMPTVDAHTGQMVVTLSMPVERADGSFAGVTAVDIPTAALLKAPRALSLLSAEAEVLVAGLVPRQEADGTLADRVQVIARHRPGTPEVADLHIQWLETGDRGADRTLALALASGNAGAIRLPWHGSVSLWAYGPVDRARTAYLLLRIPHDEVTGRVGRSGAGVHRATTVLLQVTALVSAAVVLLVALVGYAAARRIAEPARSLAAAARRLAEGDFSARAPVHGSDEIAELAQAFNGLVPDLADNIRVRNGLALAQEVQQHLLPRQPPEIPGLDLAGGSLYCDETGGDYFDFIDLETLGAGQVGIVVGDVSGHGIAAALLMTTLRAVMQSRAPLEPEPGRLLGVINDRLAKDASSGRFATLFYLIADTRRHALAWASAGHAPAIVYDPATDDFRELAGEDIPLGVMPQWDFHGHAAGPEMWIPGRVIVIATDGVWETRAPDGSMFGREALHALISRHGCGTAAEIRDAIVDALATYRAGHPPHDDVTLVVVRLVA